MKSLNQPAKKSIATTFAFAALAFFLLVLPVAQTQAQSFGISYFVMDSTSQQCEDTSYFFYGQISKIAPGDARVSLFFGDGSVEIFDMPDSAFSFSGYHTYNYPGIYSVYVLAVSDQGDRDSILLRDHIVRSDTCGNINGVVYLDKNGNCIQDSGETAPTNVMVALLRNGNIIATRNPSLNGAYGFIASTSQTYELRLYPGYDKTYDLLCPVSGKYTVSTFPSNNNDFAVQCKGGFDLAGTVAAWGIRARLPGYLTFQVRNNRCVPKSGTARFILNPLTHYQSASPAPDSIMGDTLLWNFSNLSNTDPDLSYDITVLTDSTVEIGDSIYVWYEIDPQSGDSVPVNNKRPTLLRVVNSYDPNIKTATPFGSGAAGEITPNTDITYTVHFQNTGNDVAYNIFIIDSIDPNMDITSFEYLGSKHQPVNISMLSPGVMKYRFDNIMLPDSNADEKGSHGFIQYNIKQKPNLSPGTQIKLNSAGIYFDYNPPVITNNVLHTIQLGTTLKPAALAVRRGGIWPNPASGELSILLPSAGPYELVIYNISGQEVISANGRITENEIVKADITSLTPGIYFLKVQMGDEVVVHKFSKQSQ